MSRDNNVSTDMDIPNLIEKLNTTNKKPVVAQNKKKCITVLCICECRKAIVCKGCGLNSLCAVCLAEKHECQHTQPEPTPYVSDSDDDDDVEYYTSEIKRLNTRIDTLLQQKQACEELMLNQTNNFTIKLNALDASCREAIDAIQRDYDALKLENCNLQMEIETKKTEETKPVIKKKKRLTKPKLTRQTGMMKF